jgi:hypothetical protein
MGSTSGQRLGVAAVLLAASLCAEIAAVSLLCVAASPDFGAPCPVKSVAPVQLAPSSPPASNEETYEPWELVST